MGLDPAEEIVQVALPRKSGSDQVVGAATLVVTVTPGANDMVRPTTRPSVSSCNPPAVKRISLVPAVVVTCWPSVFTPSVRRVTVVDPSVAEAICPDDP